MWGHWVVWQEAAAGQEEVAGQEEAAGQEAAAVAAGSDARPAAVLTPRADLPQAGSLMQSVGCSPALPFQDFKHPSFVGVCIKVVVIEFMCCWC